MKAKKARVAEILREAVDLRKKRDEAKTEEEKEPIRQKMGKLQVELSGLVKDLAGDDLKKQGALIEEIMKDVLPEEHRRMQSSKAKVLLKNLQTALAVYELDTGARPTTEQGLKALLKCPDDATKAAWRGPYLSSEEGLKDPWGRDFVYRSPVANKPSGYDLRSRGPDGVEGNADDVEP